MTRHCGSLPLVILAAGLPTAAFAQHAFRVELLGIPER